MNDGVQKNGRLPTRRQTVSECLVWGAPGREKTFELSVGFAPDGTAREIFLRGHKTGSDFEMLTDDACILASKALQADMGRPLAAEIAASLGGPETSLIAAALHRAATIEAAAGPGVADLHRYLARPLPDRADMESLRTGERV